MNNNGNDSRCLFHSAKGTEWKHHKYIKKEDGRYYYKNGSGGLRRREKHITGDGKSVKKGQVDSMLPANPELHQGVMNILESPTTDLFPVLGELGLQDAFNNGPISSIKESKFDESVRQNYGRKLVRTYPNSLISRLNPVYIVKRHYADAYNKSLDTLESSEKLVSELLKKLSHEDAFSDELYHHGIKGQKWGVKNGPPYPLDAEDHSKAEKEANPKLRSSSPNRDAGVNRKAGARPSLFDALGNRSSKSVKDLKKKPIVGDEDRPKAMVALDNLDSYKTRKEKVDAITEDWNKAITVRGAKESAAMNKAADLGCSTLFYEETGKYGHDWSQSARDWFIFEDQTIGMAGIASLINQGYTADQVVKIIDTVEDEWDKDDGYNNEDLYLNPAVAQIVEGNYDKRLQQFARDCYKVKNFVKKDDSQAAEDTRSAGSRPSLFDALGNKIKEHQEKQQQKREEEAKAAAKQKRLDALAKGREAAKAKRQQAQEDQKKREEHEEAKRKAIASGDPEQISKYMHELTNQEQYDAITRISQANKIKEAAKQQADARAREEAARYALEHPVEPTKYQKIMAKAKDLMMKGSDVRQLVEDGIKIYNVGAAVNNAFNEKKKLPLIDLNPAKKDDKKKDKKKDDDNDQDETKDSESTSNKPNEKSEPKQKASDKSSEQPRKDSETTKTNASQKSSEPYFRYEDNAQKLLTMASDLNSRDVAKAAESGVKYWMTVSNGGGNYHGSSSESASSYYKDRAAENRRYNEWEKEQQKNSASRIVNALGSAAADRAAREVERARSDRENEMDRIAARLKQAREARDDASKSYQSSTPSIPGMTYKATANEVKALSKVVDDIYDEIREKGYDYDEIRKRIK